MDLHGRMEEVDAACLASFDFGLALENQDAKGIQRLLFVTGQSVESMACKRHQATLNFKEMTGEMRVIYIYIHTHGNAHATATVDV